MLRYTDQFDQAQQPSTTQDAEFFPLCNHCRQIALGFVKELGDGQGSTNDNLVLNTINAVSSQENITRLLRDLDDFRRRKGFISVDVAWLSPIDASELTSSVSGDPVKSPEATATVPDLWAQAYKELDETTKKWFVNSSEPSAEGGKQRAEELITLVRTKEEAYKDKTPKLNIGGREIIWRDYANKIVSSVVAIGDISVNFAPAPSPVVWSALQVLLKTNVSQCEDLAAIFGCADKVLRFMRRGMVYEKVYLYEAPCNAAVTDLQKTLVDLYKALWQLLAHALTCVSERQGEQFLCALICPGEGADLVSALSNHEQKLSMAVQACGAIESQEHKILLQRLDEPLRHVDENVMSLLKSLQENDMDEALNYLSSISIDSHHHEKIETRTPETCEWLLKTRRFLEWEESSCSSILWLQGSVGAGKSYLTSKVIDRYKVDSDEKAKHDEGFAYFYCSRSDPARRDAKSIFHSYIRQLARVPQHPNEIHKNIYAKFLKVKEEPRRLSLAECKTSLLELVNSYPRTTLILDALDECEADDRKDLCSVLCSLVRDAKYPAKVFIASRKETDIARYLRSENLIEIGMADNKNDIEKYIETEMNGFDISWESVSEDVRDKVKRTIADQSDGMFRRAYLQWQQLKELQTIPDILERLGKLPGDLAQAYDELYARNQGYQLIVLQRAVKFILCAEKPPSDEVLLMAVRLEPRNGSGTEAALLLQSGIEQSTLESICRHLIVRDSRLKVWKFPHASVAEYFEEKHKDWTENVHEDMAILLISCLIDCYSVREPSEWDEKGKRLLEGEPDLHDYCDPRHPLQEYAVWAWVRHAKSIPNQKQEGMGVSPVLKRFLGADGPQQSSSRQYQGWCTILFKHPERHSLGLNLDPDDLRPVEKSIFGICALGIHSLLEGWWDKDMDVSRFNNRRDDLLSIAARHGHHDLCSDLIDHGSDMNRTLDSHFGSPFLAAIFGKHVETVKLFLTKGCDPNRLVQGQSPLCYAALYASEMVELLLHAGADPNIQCQDCEWGSALETAAFMRSSDAVNVLIKCGADVNLATKAGRWGSPLAAAAFSGWLERVRLFVELGAHVNARLENGIYGSVLAAALFGLSYGIGMVKYLVEEAGADPSILSSSPPPKKLLRYNGEVERQRIAEYLIEGGHVQSQVLLDIGLVDSFGAYRSEEDV